MADGLESVFAVAAPVVGMLHAPPLLGSPRWGGDGEAVRRAVLADAEALVEEARTACCWRISAMRPSFPAACRPKSSPN